MKTQIKSLINGRINVRRDLTLAKYINAPKATSHDGFAGTSYSVRNEIAQKVITENPEFMDVEIFGCKLHLVKKASCSGKTVRYNTVLSDEEFEIITGAPYPSDNMWTSSLTIHEDMTVEVTRWRRRNEKQQWKEMGTKYIGEEFITIL